MWCISIHCDTRSLSNTRLPLFFALFKRIVQKSSQRWNKNVDASIVLGHYVLHLFLRPVEFRSGVGVVRRRVIKPLSKSRVLFPLQAKKKCFKDNIVGLVLQELSVTYGRPLVHTACYTRVLLPPNRIDGSLVSERLIIEHMR